jgi:hypothetical protein
MPSLGRRGHIGCWQVTQHNRLATEPPDEAAGVLDVCLFRGRRKIAGVDFLLVGGKLVRDVLIEEVVHALGEAFVCLVAHAHEAATATPAKVNP